MYESLGYDIRDARWNMPAFSASDGLENAPSSKETVEKLSRETTEI